jgi:hypothetical protein
MALVKVMTRMTKERQSVHAEVQCNYTVVTTSAGERYLQLDTYGSPDREMSGKTSQSLQFDRGAAAQLELGRIIAETFPD